MEKGNLPTEVAFAQEPVEEARLSQGDEILRSPIMAPVYKHRKGITFAESTQSTENASQTSTSSYKDMLSQPAPGLSHRQRLLWLQRRRSPGLWAQCDDCDRWRFLSDVVDANELPAKWQCKMNPDKSLASCSAPEAPLRLRQEEDLIHAQFAAGSLVWARLPGWPWWPAMVDDCPDTEQYYWLDGFSDIPTHYNVVFFDAHDVTRAWIAPHNLKPFASNKSLVQMSKDKRYKKRLEIAVTQAEDASKLSLGKRLEKYSFIARYSGSINEPKKINKYVLQKFQKKLKRMYNIDFRDESGEDDEDEEHFGRGETTTVIKKTENMLLVGTPKSKEKKRRKTNKVTGGKNNKLDFSKDSEEPKADSRNVTKETVLQNFNTDPEVFKQLDSLLAQVGSNGMSSAVDNITFENDTPVTYAPDSETETPRDVVEKIQERAESPKSDDFDF